MKHFMLLLGFTTLSITGALAQNEDPCNCYALEGDITTNTMLNASNCYLLKGCVYVKSGAKLTIPAGTVIYGRKTDGSLVIERGAQIDAQGTSSNPIVFTSDQPDGFRNPGDWKGVTVAGYADNNLSGGTLTLDRVCDNVTGGGSSDTDNSGIMKYVQILYAGGAASGEEEVNGLTLNSVGSGTELEHIEVAHSAADGFAFLGSTVNAKYLVGYNNVQNDLTTKYGTRSLFQYGLFVRLDGSAHHSNGSNGILSINDDNNSTNTPKTQAVFSNISVIGPGYCGATGLSSDFKNGVLFAKNTEARMYNSLVAGWDVGFRIEEASTIQNANNNNSLFFAYNSFYNNTTADFTHSGSWSTPGCEATMSDWINLGNANPSSCMLGNESFSSGLGYSNSICNDLCSALPDFSVSNVGMDNPDYQSADLSNSYFDEAIYRGGLQGTDWTSTWTEWCPQDVEYCDNEKRSFVPQEINKLMLQPNPAHNITYAVFNACEGLQLRLQLTDNVSGTVLKEIVYRTTSDGEQKIAVPVNGIKAGIYLVKVLMPDGTTYGAQLVIE